MFLYLLTVFGGVVGVAFLTLCLACGLYFLAEFIEENTVLTKKIIRYTIWASLGAHMILWVADSFPFLRIVFSMACLGWYSLMLPAFPAINISSAVFIVSCVLVITNHFVWFVYFAGRRTSFSEIASFFGLLVWLVPFLFFISLTANDYTLPAFDARAHSPKPSDPDVAYKKRSGNIIKAFAAFLSSKKEELMPSSSSKIL
ncbi:erv26 superfamily protein [Polyrhizophydium stewartii]|uniref:Erv26 superfamily protein n=1 Tax=Polyrhizophydium stewartii TaxID=2732419 RepID=A0ABR4NBU1_9FUNG